LLQDQGQSDYEAVQSLDAGGRTWTVNFTSTRSFDRAATAGWTLYLAAAGLVVTLLLTSAAWAQERATSAALRAREELRLLNASLESRVAERTAALSDEIHKRQESEDRLRQMQKLEAIGQLTGGIAHDFNNMLAVIIGSLRLLERRLQRGDPNPQEFIESAKSGAERAAELTRRLLAFARKQPLAPEATDINKLLAGISELIRRTLPASISVETVLAGGLWRTNIDARELENALLNLVVNARDAMPEGGRLTIETANAHLDDAYAAEHSDVTAGQYVMVAVTDNGPGMTREVAARAFEPFFTTKAAGKGTGLGLSQVHGFIKQSGGHIKLYSEPGQGLTIKLYLPRHYGTPAEARSASDQSRDVPRAVESTLILVVEDDPEVLKVSVGMLAELGYQTLSATGGAQALELIDAHQDIALLLTDVVMPEMNGRRLADLALQRRPSLKVLFTTGYSRNAIVHNDILDHNVELIQKPFSLEALAQKVNRVLRTPRS
jgi:signal transduction histidine kinase/CheY-like chemotaxis protein